MARTRAIHRWMKPTLARIHGAGYPPAIEAGLMSVMASYNSWNSVKMHGHKGALTDILKGTHGLPGLHRR